MTSDPLLGARRVRELLETHGVRPSKALGQNFVVDPNTIRKVVEIAGIEPEDEVLEIGAGAGSLTLALAARAARVVALEVDPRLVAALAESLAGVTNIEVIEGDALRVDLSGVTATRLVANLPYNIAATVVVRVLQEAPAVAGLTVMTQREVGERLAAGPGSKTYGLTSALVSFYGTARVAAPVSRRAFFPVPTVDSVIVSIDRTDPPDVDAGVYARVVRAAFAQRRKTLRNTLATVAPVETVERALAQAGISPSARAETVPRDGFVALARLLERA